MLLCLICALVVSSAHGSDAGLRNYIQDWREVVEDPPEDLLEVNYGGKEVAIGSELTPTEVKSSPTVQWNAEPGIFYTLSMVDPDAPSRTNPVAREWNHWLVVNIPGNKVEQGESITTYQGASPPSGTGLHRYILMVFRQGERMDFDEPEINSRKAAKRSSFSIKKFASKYNLGTPVAGNFFKSQSES